MGRECGPEHKAGLSCTAPTHCHLSFFTSDIKNCAQNPNNSLSLQQSELLKSGSGVLCRSVPIRTDKRGGIHNLQHHPAVSLCSSSRETSWVMVKGMEGELRVFPLVQSLFPVLLIQEVPPQTFWKHENHRLLVHIEGSVF